MSEHRRKRFRFIDLRDGVLVYERQIGEPLFQIQIPGVEIEIVPLDSDAKTSDTSGRFSDAAPHRLLRLQIRQLIGLKMNLTLQLLKIINSRSRDEVLKLAKDSLYDQNQTNMIVAFAAFEQKLLVARLNHVFDKWAQEVMLKKTANEVEEFFRNLKDTVVMGPFAAANILDEKVDS